MRRILFAIAGAVLLSSCGKPADPAQGKPGTPAKEPAKPPIDHTKPPDGDKPPVQPKPGDEEGGWTPAPVPESMKDVPATSIFRMIRTKDSVFVDNLQKVYVGEGGKDEVKAISWRIEGSDLMKEMQASKVDTHLFVRLKGRRILEKRYFAPAGYSGEKHDYVFRVESVTWKKTEQEYFHEMTILEEELWDLYVDSIADEGVAEKVASWKTHQARAEDLGWGITERMYDPAVPPFQTVVEAFTRIGALQSEVQKKAGDIAEISAWLKLQSEWGHLPSCPVTGDLDLDREKRAKENSVARTRMAEAGLAARLKSGITAKPDMAAEFLAATDATAAQALMRAAADAGQTLLAAHVALAICGDAKVDAKWKNTTLSSLKQAIVDNPKFFEAWPDAECASFPGRLRDNAVGWTKGNVIYTRNAIAIVEGLRKVRPAIAYAPAIDAVIEELKKK